MSKNLTLESALAVSGEDITTITALANLARLAKALKGWALAKPEVEYLGYLNTSRSIGWYRHVPTGTVWSDLQGAPSWSDERLMAEGLYGGSPSAEIQEILADVVYHWCPRCNQRSAMKAAGVCRNCRIERLRSHPVIRGIALKGHNRILEGMGFPSQALRCAPVDEWGSLIPPRRPSAEATARVNRAAEMLGVRDAWVASLLWGADVIQGGCEVPTTVRWMGAFGRKSDLSKIAHFESKPGRPVSAEPFVAGVSRLTHPQVGLLVDPTRTTLLAAFSRDAYTPRVGSEEVKVQSPHGFRGRELEVCSEWGQIEGLDAAHETHREAILWDPAYSAVVYRDGGEAFAMALAEEMGLPCHRVDF